MMLILFHSTFVSSSASLVPTGVLAWADDISITGQTSKQSVTRRSCWVMWPSTISLFDVLFGGSAFCFFAVCKMKRQIVASVSIRGAQMSCRAWSGSVGNTADSLVNRRSQCVEERPVGNLFMVLKNIATYLKGKQIKICCKLGKVLLLLILDVVVFQVYDLPSLQKKCCVNNTAVSLTQQC